MRKNFDSLVRNMLSNRWKYKYYSVEEGIEKEITNAIQYNIYDNDELVEQVLRMDLSDNKQINVTNYTSIKWTRILPSPILKLLIDIDYDIDESYYISSTDILYGNRPNDGYFILYKPTDLKEQVIADINKLCEFGKYPYKLLAIKFYELMLVKHASNNSPHVIIESGDEYYSFNQIEKVEEIRFPNEGEPMTTAMSELIEDIDAKNIEQCYKIDEYVYLIKYKEESDEYK